MTMEKTNEKQLDASRIVCSLSRSDKRMGVHLRLCEVYPNGETEAQISQATGYDKDTILGTLTGNKAKYKAEDALVTIGLVTVREDDAYGQKFTIFTGISDGKDIDDLLKNYALKHGPLKKLKEYVKKLEKKFEERKKKKHP